MTLDDAKRVAKRLLDTKSADFGGRPRAGLEQDELMGAVGGFFTRNAVMYPAWPRFSRTSSECASEKIPAHGVAKAALDDAFGRCEDALAWLRKRHAAESLPLLRLPVKTDDLDSYLAKGSRPPAQDATDIVFLGTGGSSSAGRLSLHWPAMPCPDSGLSARARGSFYGSPRPRTFAVLLAGSRSRLRFIAISNPAAPVKR